MRKLLLLFVVLTTGVLFVARLFYLQVYDVSAAVLSESNAIKEQFEIPQRGRIYDRYGELLVSNQPSYDLMAIPREIKPFDTLKLCSLLNITKEDLLKQLNKATNYSPRHPSVIVPTMSQEEFAYLGEQMRKFEGFFIQKRSLRDYQINFGANFLGYIQEVHQGIIDKKPYYRSGDLIGRQGVEQQYEKILRGEKGVKYLQKDRFNRVIGPYKEGTLDKEPVEGKNIYLTIDAELQKYGQELMKGKRGGIVAIEPATGEILALITAPNYEPALMVGRSRSKNYSILDQDSIAKPLYDRALLGEYSPGSPFKALTGLIALQEGAMTLENRVYCRGKSGLSYGRGRSFGCHNHRSPLKMIEGIAYSCNAYFGTAYLNTLNKFDTPQEGMTVWEGHLKSFGLGDFMGYDLPIGKRGLIPTAQMYNRTYDYPKRRWGAAATLSNSIGQGEVLMTPVQMAHFTATIANRGWYYKPHILKKIEGTDTIPSEFSTKNYTTVDPEHFEPIIQGLNDVYNYGTAGNLRVPDINISGKTGTAENYAKINGITTQLTDHSTFIAFAPKDNPKIAIAIFVENGYWGSRYGGRIASLMIEKYIKKEITRTDLEDWILTHSLEEEYAKPLSGKPFRINY